MNEIANTVRDNYIQVSLGGADESGEFSLVFALHILESENSGGLLVDDRTETSLTLYDDVGHTHLTAESGKEDNEFDGVNIMGNDDERGLLGLNEGNGVVKTVLDE